MLANHEAALHFIERFARGDAFDLRPVRAAVRVLGRKEFLVQKWLVAEEQEALAVRIETAERIRVLRKLKRRERAVLRSVVSELAEDAEWFVEGDEHRSVKAIHS
jgi:hypothetical protein